MPFKNNAPQTIVLVGLMGAGKTSIGKRIARNLDLPFVDADSEIEKAAGCSVSDIFERFGEQAFRDGEVRVIKRLIKGDIKVIATGGGAFMNKDLRDHIKENAISIWLKADIDTLYARVIKTDHRPLLRAGNPREILERLMEQRYPLYAEADIVVESVHKDVDKIVEDALNKLKEFLDKQNKKTKTR